MMNLRQQEQRICRKSEQHIDAAFKKSKCCEVGVDERLLLMKLNRLNRFPSTVLLACCMCSLCYTLRENYLFMSLVTATK